MELKKLFGKKLQEIRGAKGLTQEELATLIDMQANTIAKYESGIIAPSFMTLEKIVKNLDKDYADFFDFKTAKTPNRRMKIIYNVIEDFDDDMFNLAISCLEQMKQYNDSKKN